MESVHQPKRSTIQPLSAHHLLSNWIQEILSSRLMESVVAMSSVIQTAKCIREGAVRNMDGVGPPQLIAELDALLVARLPQRLQLPLREAMADAERTLVERLVKLVVHMVVVAVAQVIAALLLIIVLLQMDVRVAALGHRPTSPQRLQNQLQQKASFLNQSSNQRHLLLPETLR